MRPIPNYHKKIIDSDVYFRKCVLCGLTQVEIHHCFIYCGRQISEMWNYVPLCHEHHVGNKGFHKYHVTKEIVELHVLHKMTDEDYNKYYKRNFKQELNYLNSKYAYPNKTDVS